MARCLREFGILIASNPSTRFFDKGGGFESESNRRPHNWGLSVDAPLAKERRAAYFEQNEDGMFSSIARAGGLAGSSVK
jgi:hypothetical protein